jgi:SAM-dependent methyltransferase
VDRQAWIADRRAAVVAAYDSEASTYDENEYPAETQRRWTQRLLELLPPGGLVLDAPCGTGRYFAMIETSGIRVVGIDGSAAMLSLARARGVAERLEHSALQDLSYENAFDGIMTVDAMENVPPEDWPMVLANLHRAVRPGGYLYMTVEEMERSEVEHSFEALAASGAPAVLGEVVEGDVAGYHYYPDRARVVEWLDAEDLAIVDEGFERDDGWGYRHFLLRSP